MSKLTFRADDDLVSRLEEFDTSKSEVLREALREYIERHADSTARAGSSGTADPVGERLDDLLAERIDAVLAERLGGTRGTQDINVNITLDGPQSAAVPETRTEASADVNAPGDASGATSHESSHNRAERNTDPGDDANAADEDGKTCTQCGEILSPSHVYCPNCGEKSAHRVFCECGDELRSDWAFCPGCGRRTPAADVLDGS
jgi:Arc/MetJ-type ribon-helix-helix transcriptional regulator